MIDVKLDAHAGPYGDISVCVNVTDNGKLVFALDSDLNSLLATRLYKAGYPREEAHRLKGMERIHYSYAPTSPPAENSPE